MKTVQTIELSEEERKTVRNFIDIMDKISNVVLNKSMEDVALYFCNNTVWANGTWNVDRVHQIEKIRQKVRK